MAAHVLWVLSITLPQLYGTKTCKDKVCSADQTCVVLHKALNRKAIPYCLTQESLDNAVNTQTQCRNGGYKMPCYSLNSECHVPKECVCPQEFTGVNCEYRYCERSFGGACAYGVCDSQRGCLCYPGFYGNRCEYKMCSLSGRCVHGDCEDGTCKCNSGYSSVACDEVECNGLKCLNDGYCRLGSCVCMRGFFGLNCEMKICPKTFVPCYQGDCSPGGACICYEGYTGEHCNYKACSSTICSQFSECGVAEGEDCLCTSHYSGLNCETGCSEENVIACKPGLQDAPISVIALPERTVPWYIIFMLTMFLVTLFSVGLAYKMVNRVTSSEDSQTQLGRSNTENQFLYEGNQGGQSLTYHPLNTAVTRSYVDTKSILSQKTLRSTSAQSTRANKKQSSTQKRERATSSRASTDSRTLYEQNVSRHLDDEPETRSVHSKTSLESNSPFISSSRNDFDSRIDSNNLLTHLAPSVPSAAISTPAPSHLSSSIAQETSPTPSSDSLLQVPTVKVFHMQNATKTLTPSLRRVQKPFPQNRRNKGKPTKESGKRKAQKSTEL